MAATSTRQATSAITQDVLPACPDCRSAMVVRAQWSGGRVTGLYWGCSRAPGCEGMRRIRNPEVVRPLVYDASAQAIFDWESSRDGSLSRRHPAPVAQPNAGGLRGLVGRVRARSEAELEEPEWTPENASVGHFDALVELGFVVLENRRTGLGRVAVDNLIIGPSGIFVVERKQWAGQVMTTPESVFVDGRQRIGATDDVIRVAAAIEQALDYELKPLGTSVRPALLFEFSSNRQFEATVGKVLMGGTRGLPKLIRGRSEPVLGPETIVRLAVAADRLLE